MVDWDGLENRCAGNRTVGSNPTLSAIFNFKRMFQNDIFEEIKIGPTLGPTSAVKVGAGAISSVAGAWGTVEPLLHGHFGL